MSAVGFQSRHQPVSRALQAERSRQIPWTRAIDRTTNTTAPLTHTLQQSSIYVRENSHVVSKAVVDRTRVC